MLLDALVAFAIVALALATILITLPRLAERDVARLSRHQASEFAYSKFEEFRMAFPALDLSGTDPSGWAWQIAERPGGMGSSDLIDLVTVQVTTWHIDQPELRVTLSGIVARRSGQ